jgi:3-deoxy-7-phosphoheptulonate synthase
VLTNRSRRLEIGGDSLAIIAGPCSVENREQIQAIAGLVAGSGSAILRGSTFRMPFSPYSFPGLGEEGLQLLREAADQFGLFVVSEISDREQLPLFSRYVDILQVGARNMQNFNLLKELGRMEKPVLLKRGIAATLEELLLSAEHVMAGGNRQVLLCERGIRTFEGAETTTLDLAAIPMLKRLTHLPVLVDPSHGTGRRDKVIPMARAAVAAGADGLMVEVHNQPERALNDGAQSLYPSQFAQLVHELTGIAKVVGKTLA